MTESAKAQVIVVKQEKSMAIAYVLLIFLGGLGIHRFYLGRVGTGITQLILSIIGWATVMFIIGIFFLAILGVWLLIDLFLTAGIVNAENAKLHAGG
ncbi:TM2 domain-containing protein [Salinisphaera sp.]|uniref:TM2 domain-containing protein n=1 Tax=Salinisphaera sp. TaxID=1914330 RepID=UPI002D796A5D|nr:TM2 domain-containing protein [Salinisphaera sp.]HET7312965.1 TM2 domain-containing protein [Salinisphaera sp.]